MGPSTSTSDPRRLPSGRLTPYALLERALVGLLALPLVAGLLWLWLVYSIMFGFSSYDRDPPAATLAADVAFSAAGAAVLGAASVVALTAVRWSFTGTVFGRW